MRQPVRDGSRRRNSVVARPMQWEKSPDSPRHAIVKSMGFDGPAYLVLLQLAPALAWWWMRRRRVALRHSNLESFDSLPVGRARRSRAIAAALRGGALFFLVLALAGPQVPDRTTRLPTEGIAIAFALDVSGSMGERDFRPVAGNEPVTRLDAARRAFALFLEGGAAPDGTKFDGRRNDQVGLVAFAAWPHTECPLTLNHSVLLAILGTLEPKGAGLDAGTNIGDAIAEGLIRLKTAADRRRVLILLSDGEHNATGDGPDAPFAPRQAAQLAANLGIAIYAIDCGGEPKPDAGTEARQQRESGRAALKTVAEITGGRYFAANNGPELLEVYREIDRLERGPIISFLYRRYHRFGTFCAAAALACLALAIAADRLVWRSLP